MGGGPDLVDCVKDSQLVPGVTKLQLPVLGRTDRIIWHRSAAFGVVEIQEPEHSVQVRIDAKVSP